jgi:hypothetical protein
MWQCQEIGCVKLSDDRAIRIRIIRTKDEWHSASQGAKWGILASSVGSLVFGLPAVILMLEFYKEPIGSFLNRSLEEYSFLLMFVGIPALAASFISFVLTVIPSAAVGALLAMWFDAFIPRLKPGVRTAYGALIGGASGYAIALLITLGLTMFPIDGHYPVQEVIMETLIYSLLPGTIAFLAGGWVGWRLSQRY